MKLDHFIEISVGINVTRLNKPSFTSKSLYTNEDLIHDLSVGITSPDQAQAQSNKMQKDSPKYLIQEGDILYSFISSTASIASAENVGKVLNQNFAKLTLLTNVITSRYLCYFLNESTEIARQMSVVKQGSNKRRMTPSMLGTIEIKKVPLSKQQKIGDYYFMAKRYLHLTLLETELMQKIHFELLKKMNAK